MVSLFIDIKTVEESLLFKMLNVAKLLTDTQLDHPQAHYPIVFHVLERYLTHLYSSNYSLKLRAQLIYACSCNQDLSPADLPRSKLDRLQLRT